jgi:S-DNA-T family DNA segregation ATPase FtsK/SpoIIIE
LRSIALGATLAKEIAPVHVYALDAASGALDMLRPLPHVPDVVAVDDPERVGRMMSRLATIVRERLEAFTQERASSLTQYRAKSGERGLPRILLLVDGYGTFQSDYMLEPGRGHIFSDFQEVLATGHTVGVHAILSADRVGALHTTVQALISRTIVLRLSDENQYGMVGLRKTGLGPDSPPGRGVDLASRRELQVAVYGGSSRIDIQARAIEQLAAKIPDRPEWQAEPIPRIPSVVPGASMPADVAGLPTLGIDSDTLLPRGFDTERAVMIAGQAGTGRTNALAWLATAIRRVHPKRRIIHVTQRRTSIGSLPAWTASFVGQSAGEDFLAKWGKELDKAADGDNQVVVCIENVQDFGASMSDGPLVQAIKNGRRNGHLIIGEADTQGWSSGQLVSELKAARRGLLLAPEGADSQMLFAAQSPRLNRAELPPGRGVWIENGRVSLVQIPLVDGDYSPDK